MNKAIEFIDVSKSFGTTKALNNLNLYIEKGDFYGLLGPNGAGKSTLIGILGGLIIPDTGATYVMDYNVRSEYVSARKSLGIVPQELVFDPFFTVYETLSFQLGYFGKKIDKKWILELLDSLGLANKIYSNMRTLSGGMKRRVLLAQALVHKPEVVVLDEPTAGVDVQLRSTIWDLIKKINNDGTTILLTTHYLEEAEQLCNKTAFVNNGNLIANQETKNFFKSSANKSLLLTIKNSQAINNLNMKNIHLHSPDKIEFTFSNLSEITDILNLLNSKKIEIINFEIKELDLEKIFLSYLNS